MWVSQDARGVTVLRVGTRGTGLISSAFSLYRALENKTNDGGCSLACAVLEQAWQRLIASRPDDRLPDLELLVLLYRSYLQGKQQLERSGWRPEDLRISTDV